MKTLKDEVCILRIEINNIMLEGILVFLNNKVFLEKIKPHEEVIPEKVLDLTYKIMLEKQVVQPIVCLADGISTRQYKTNKIFHEKITNNHSYVLYDCDRVVYNQISRINSLLLADGHHRFAVLQNRKIVKVINTVPILIFNTNALKQHPVVHYVNESILLPDDSYLNTKIAYKGNHPIKIQFGNTVKEAYLKNLKDFAHLYQYLFSGCAKVIKRVPMVDMVLKHSEKNKRVGIRMPFFTNTELFSCATRGELLPPHSTYFYPKIPTDVFTKITKFIRSKQ